MIGSGCVMEVPEPPHVCSPMSVVENSVGKKRLVVNLRHLNRFLWKQKFNRVFQTLPGHTTLAEHRIQTENVVPVRLPPYRIPQAFREPVHSELKEMLDHGVIERSTSDWASPMVTVKKKDGSLRLCVDYRRLNGLSKADAYPMPLVDDWIDRVGNAKFISTLDLTKGYWQVPVRESDREKTAFPTPYGLFQFRAADAIWPTGCPSDLSEDGR